MVATGKEAAESSNAFPAIGAGVLAEPILRIAFQFREHRPLRERIAAVCGVDTVAVNNANATKRQRQETWRGVVCHARGGRPGGSRRFFRGVTH